MMTTQQMIRYYKAAADKTLAIVTLAAETGRKRDEIKQIVGYDPTAPMIASPPPARSKARGLADLTEVLFDSLDRINDAELNGTELADEAKRANAVANISGKIIQTANTMLSAYKASSEIEGKLPELLDPNRSGEA